MYIINNLFISHPAGCMWQNTTSNSKPWFLLDKESWVIKSSDHQSPPANLNISFIMVKNTYKLLLTVAVYRRNHDCVDKHFYEDDQHTHKLCVTKFGTKQDLHGRSRKRKAVAAKVKFVHISISTMSFTFIPLTKKTKQNIFLSEQKTQLKKKWFI